MRTGYNACIHPRPLPSTVGAQMKSEAMVYDSIAKIQEQNLCILDDEQNPYILPLIPGGAAAEAEFYIDSPGLYSLVFQRCSQSSGRVSASIQAKFQNPLGHYLSVGD